MAPTERRGPRYRLPRPMPSGECREPLNDLLARELGLSDDMVRRLRWDWPQLLGRAICLMRQHGHADAIASIAGPIDAAMTEPISGDLHAAIVAATEAEATANVAEQRWLLEPTPENRRAMLRAHALELLAEQRRDHLLRLEN